MGYVSGSRFGVVDFLRDTHRLFSVPGAAAIGAVSCDVLTPNSLAVVFFAKDNRLYAHPLFPGIDLPFENAEICPSGNANSAGDPNEPGVVELQLPPAGMECDWIASDFKPLKLVSALSGG